MNDSKNFQLPLVLFLCSVFSPVDCPAALPAVQRTALQAVVDKAREIEGLVSKGRDLSGCLSMVAAFFGCHQCLEGGIKGCTQSIFYLARGFAEQPENVLGKVDFARISECYYNFDRSQLYHAGRAAMLRLGAKCEQNRRGDGVSVEITYLEAARAARAVIIFFSILYYFLMPLHDPSLACAEEALLFFVPVLATAGEMQGEHILLEQLATVSRRYFARLKEFDAITDFPTASTVARSQPLAVPRAGGGVAGLSRSASLGLGASEAGSSPHASTSDSDTASAQGTRVSRASRPASPLIGSLPRAALPLPLSKRRTPLSDSMSIPTSRDVSPVALSSVDGDDSTFSPPLPALTSPLTLPSFSDGGS